MIRLPPNITFDMLQPEFWLDRVSNPDTPLIDSQAIEAFNTRVYEVLDIPQVLDLPGTLSGDEVRGHIQRSMLSKRPYYMQESPVNYAELERILTGSLPLSDQLPVTFGLITQRTNVRTLPLSIPITSEPFRFAYDRAQETTVDVGWPVASVYESNDTWAFCLTPHYWGWMRRDHITTGTREAVEAYAQAEPFILTVNSQAGVMNTATGHCFAVQMGTKLPLLDEQAEVYTVRVPAPDQFDTPLAVQGLAPKLFDEFHRDYLPLTLRTLFTQAFKLLGEPYAWGGSRMGIFGRDCSRLIRDVYATAGVYLPRNGDQQQRVCTTQIAFAPEMPDADRKTTLCEQATPGALLILPGHVMLYLGCVDGEPYAIHATSSNSYNEIVVSDLSLGCDTESGSLLRRLTHAVIPS